MKNISIQLLLIATGLILLASTGQSQPPQFNVPVEGYDWVFPRDHANHPDYQVEWWYYTGHFIPDGLDEAVLENWIHFQLTFFRNGLEGEKSGEMYFAHFAMSGGGREFKFDEKIARGTLGEAGSTEHFYHVWIDDWQAQELDGKHILEAWSEELGGFRLIAEPKSEPVLHGINGLSVKGSEAREASYYYSIPDFEIKGVYLPPEDSQEKPESIHGTVWMDHEFGNQQLGEGLVGWDWFGLQLPGGDALMIYLIRSTDGTPIPQSSGTWIPVGDNPQIIDLDDVAIETIETWKSTQSGATYPSGWKIQIPTLNLKLSILPVSKDQELLTKRSTRVTYWEGAVKIEREGYSDSSFGFVELVGYDHQKPLK
ncbi:hypothetical protein K8I28_13295 [bacterium]|nr:hypothetical protein [bacterium]